MTPSSPRFLISTPTMVASSEDVSDSMNVALAAAAAFQAVHMQNATNPGSITSIALPGLGANTGRVPPEICADLMWTAYDLFRSAQLPDFQTMRAALEGLLGDLGPATTTYKKSFVHPNLPSAHKATIPDSAAAQAQLKKKIAEAQKDALDDDKDFEDEDFDDFE